MTEHVAEEPIAGPNFTKVEIKIFENVLALPAEEAFDWLLSQLQEYVHGKLIWLDVRNTLATARKWQENCILQKKLEIEAEIVEAVIEEVVNAELEEV